MLLKVTAILNSRTAWASCNDGAPFYAPSFSGIIDMRTTVYLKCDLMTSELELGWMKSKVVNVVHETKLLGRAESK